MIRGFDRTIAAIAALSAASIGAAGGVAAQSTTADHDPGTLSLPAMQACILRLRAADKNGHGIGGIVLGGMYCHFVTPADPTVPRACVFRSLRGEGLPLVVVFSAPNRPRGADDAPSHAAAVVLGAVPPATGRSIVTCSMHTGRWWPHRGGS